MFFTLFACDLESSFYRALLAEESSCYHFSQFSSTDVRRMQIYTNTDKVNITLTYFEHSNILVVFVYSLLSFFAGRT